MSILKRGNDRIFKFISVILIATFVWQNLAWGQTINQLRKLAFDEGELAHKGEPLRPFQIKQPHLALYILKGVLKISFEAHRRQSLIHNYALKNFIVDTSSIPPKVELLGSANHYPDKIPAAEAMKETESLSAFVKSILFPAKAKISAVDKNKILLEISTLSVPLIQGQRAISAIKKAYNDRIFPLLDQLIFKYLEAPLRAAVDSRDLAEAEHLVSQIQTLSEGTRAVLVKCPRETSPIESKKLIDLNNDVVATLTQNGITDKSAIFAVNLIFDESAANVLRHARDNLKDEDEDKPIFGVVIVRIIQERDGIKLEFIFQDNGGGQDVEQLCTKITAATTPERIEVPTGRGIFLTAHFVFTKFKESGFYYIVSHSAKLPESTVKRLTFTGFDKERGPQANPPVKDSTINNGLLAHVGFKIPFAVAPPQTPQTVSQRNLRPVLESI